MPKEIFNANVLKKDFELPKAIMEVLNILETRYFFTHPYFDNLNLKATIKMLKLHTKHHINIINDIIKG